MYCGVGNCFGDGVGSCGNGDGNCFGNCIFAGDGGILIVGRVTGYGIVVVELEEGWLFRIGWLFIVGGVCSVRSIGDVSGCVCPEEVPG